ncbi:Bud site selection protein bud4 [Ceratobasidium sp. 414]|nr:Bud site selection protein bud4 [Ceratobasidium sp. 414]
MLEAVINNHLESACTPDRTSEFAISYSALAHVVALNVAMSTSYLPSGITPLRIQKGSSRSPSPAKEPPLHPVNASTPTPYTLKPRNPSNASSHQEGARRTSSSYSHLRSNSLVSNSPFRLNGVEPVGPRHRPAPSGFNVYRHGPPPPSARSSLHISMGTSEYDSQDSDTRPLALTGPRPLSKIPTPSRRVSGGGNRHKGLALVPIGSDSDAPPNAHKTEFRRRQSRGLQTLSDNERVSKSPFVARLSADRQDVVSPSSGGEWEDTEASAGPESSPEIGVKPTPAIPEETERAHELPELPTPNISPEPRRVHEDMDASPPPPPPKPLHARLAAITARASTPPRARVSTPPRALSIDTSPMSSPTAGVPSPATPTSAYKTPLSSQSTPVKNAEPSTPTPSTPTSPAKSPRRSSANSPSPTRSALVSKRLLGPRSSPSPRPGVSSPTADSPNTSGVSRTSSGRLVVRKSSGVNRKNSRVRRKSSNGRYVPLNRRGSTKNGRKRKTVTFDERCDVLEFDAGVGIDGEVWSEGEWSDQDQPEEGLGNERGQATNESPDVSVDGGLGRRRYASPPMVPSGGWNEPVAWGSSSAMSASGSGSISTSGSRGSLGQSGSTNSMQSSGSGSGRYANLGLGSPHEELETYGFGRQAALAMSTPTRIGMGAPGFTPGRRGSRTGASAPTFAPGRPAAGRAAGGVFGESARDSFSRTGRGVAKDLGKDSFGRVDAASRQEDEEVKAEESGAKVPDVPDLAEGDSAQDADDNLPAQDSADSLPTKRINGGLSALDMFDRVYPLEDPGTPDLRAYGSSVGTLKVVNGSPDPSSGPETEQTEERRQDSDYEQHANELSEVHVHHSGEGVVVHHTGGAGTGVVVHHSGAGMVQGVYMRRAGTDGAAPNGNLSTEGVTVHHSGHSAVQVYNEQSPDLSAGDISLGGAGLSFASLLSFDSIISRGETSRMRVEEEEGEESFVGGRLLDGLDGLDAEEVVVKVEEEEVQLEFSPTPDSSGLGATLGGELGTSASQGLEMDLNGELAPSSTVRPGFELAPSHSLPGIAVVSPLLASGVLPSSNPSSRSNSSTQPVPQPIARPIEPRHTGGSVSGRSPRISRDEVLRRLKDRQSGSTSPSSYNRAGSSTPTLMDGAESPAEEESRPARGPRMSGSRLEIERLMAGVEQGFAEASGEGDSLGFNPADQSHTSLPYRRKDQPEEQEEPEPEPAPIPPPPASSRAPMPSATNSVASGETETEAEEAVTPPVARMFMSGPGIGPQAFQLSPEIARLDPGRPSSFLDEFPSRPSSFLSTSSAGLGGELTGRARIKAHEEKILAKRRELRGGPSRPRSKSFADPLPRIPDKPEQLEIPVDSSELALEESFNEQMNKIYHQSEARSYYLREADHTIYVDDKVKHNRRAGDVDNGKAWRTVRRPSDMPQNEYSRQIKELHAQAGSIKAHGKVFVKVRGLQRLCVPIPQQPTYFTCTLNNGIHFVTTPECRLEQNAVIDQEFELIEHGKLEFTLTIKVRKDSHIINQINQMHAPLPSAPSPAPPPPKPSGFRSLFSSTPKKQPKQALFRRPDSFVEDHLVRYMKGDGSLGRAYINFRDIVKRCDTRLFETSYPLVGEWAEDSVRGAAGIPGPAMPGPTSQRPVGELVLQIFRLPPLPGVPPETLPQSLEECHRGLRAVAWHKKIYHQGILTQSGGDVMTWRRRQLRVIGSNLVAYNDITGRAIATIDLKRALAVEDDQQPLPPNAIPGRRPRDESHLAVERSFRLIFGDDDDIAFFADTEEEKAEWLRILRALVGNIPPHPLWAELVWQRHEQAAAAQQAQQNQPVQHLTSPDQVPAGQAPPPPSKPVPPPPRPQAWR